MYARKVADRSLTFDFGWGLLDDNLLFVDRETKSVWSQLAGKAIQGDLENTPLEIIPAVQTTWGFWREHHPHTRVMIREGEAGRPYTYRNPEKRRAESEGHDTSGLGLGVVVGGQAMFYPLSGLRAVRSPLKTQLGGENLRIHHDQAGMTAWAETADGDLIAAVLVYESGWRSFFPESSVFGLTE